MKLSIAPAQNKKLAYGLYALSLGLLASTIALAASVSSAQAVAPGTDWGPGGLMAPTDSAVTVAWDNGGNTPEADKVPRDSSQVLPHTGGKTYADLDPTVNDGIAQDFGGMKLTVSQTAGLRHQAVDLTVTGVQAGTNPTPNGLTVMQCWGAAGETAPDPANCEEGVGVVDSSSTDYRQSPRRIDSVDLSLTSGGDLKAPTTLTLNGQVQGGTSTLVATVLTVDANGSSNVAATGAAGKVEFDRADGSALATVQVSNGQAKTTTPAPATGSSTGYTAHYIAAPTENYLDSDPNQTQTLTLPADSAPLPSAPTSGNGTNTSPNVTPKIPFHTVDGTWTGTLGQYFDQTTTNEIGNVPAPADASGTSTETFEMLTGAESPGLGCGAREDQPSTGVCWLVAVPIDTAVSSGTTAPPTSPLTPTRWAQRVQVKLAFAPVAPSCGAGVRQLSIGSELLVDAMNSWIPAICTGVGVDLGYVQNGDSQARDQYTSQSASLIFTSAPVDDSGGGTSTLYAPAGLSAVTIGVFAINSSHQFVTGIKLNARLVTKLLTESYRQAIDPTSSGTSADSDDPWVTKLPQSLVTDPEFHALNPQLPASGLQSDVVVTVAGSDATTAVWNWLLADPDAKAFLDGCPDSASRNTVINPFYSTRSYAECQDQAATLEATALARRSPQSSTNPDGTKLPATFDATSVPQYPPTGAAFPQPGYYEHPAVTDSQGNVTQLPLTLADLHPRENTFAAIAADVFRGQEKTFTTWCTDTVVCGGVVTPPGVWVNGNPPIYGAGVLGLTDGTAAATDLIPTALLCDDSGDNCVGANDDSLQKAASTFVPSATSSHFLQPPAKPDYAGGAYPLTLPVYAEINTKGLPQADATAYAKVLQFISTTGQQQGFDSGNLPPGMAPLPDAMVAQTAAAVQTLQQIKDPPPVDDSGTGDLAPPDTDQLPPVGFVPAGTDGGAPTPSATPTPQAKAGPVGVTPASAVGFFPFGVGAGIVGALIAGIAAPIVGRKRRA